LSENYFPKSEKVPAIKGYVFYSIKRLITDVCELTKCNAPGTLKISYSIDHRTEPGYLFDKAEAFFDAIANASTDIDDFIDSGFEPIKDAATCPSD
jgi:hypothetical protein